MILAKICIKCMPYMTHDQTVFRSQLLCYYSTNMLHTKINKYIHIHIHKQTNKTIIPQDLALKKNSSKVNEDTIKKTMQELTLELFYLYLNTSVM